MISFIQLNLSFKTFLFENDFKSFLPEFFFNNNYNLSFNLWCCFIALLYKKKYPLLLENISWLTILTLIYSIALIENNPINKAMLFYNTLIMDEFTLFLKLIVLGSAFFSILIAMDYMNSESMNSFEYMILVLSIYL